MAPTTGEPCRYRNRFRRPWYYRWAWGGESCAKQSWCFLYLAFRGVSSDHIATWAMIYIHGSWVFSGVEVIGGTELIPRWSGSFVVGFFLFFFFFFFLLPRPARSCLVWTCGGSHGQTSLCYRNPFLWFYEKKTYFLSWHQHAIYQASEFNTSPRSFYAQHICYRFPIFIPSLFPSTSAVPISITKPNPFLIHARRPQHPF